MVNRKTSLQVAGLVEKTSQSNWNKTRLLSVSTNYIFSVFGAATKKIRKIHICILFVSVIVLRVIIYCLNERKSYKVCASG